MRARSGSLSYEPCPYIRPPVVLNSERDAHAQLWNHADEDVSYGWGVLRGVEVYPYSA